MLYIPRQPFPLDNTVYILSLHHEPMLPLCRHSLMLCYDFPLYLLAIVDKDVSQGKTFSLPEGTLALYSETDKSFPISSTRPDIMLHLLGESWHCKLIRKLLFLVILLHPLALLLNVSPLLVTLVHCIGRKHFSVVPGHHRHFTGLIAFSSISQFSINNCEFHWNASTPFYLFH